MTMREAAAGLAMLVALAAWGGPAAADPGPPAHAGVACDEDPFDGYQRNCRLEDAADPPTPQERRLLVEQEGRLFKWIGDMPPTADAPLEFRGWWVEPGKACVAWGDDSQLRIGVNLAQFYAGEGRIQSVKVLGPGEIEMVLDMHTDPGDQPALHLKLSEDGTRLFQMDLDDGYERVRCDGWP